MEEKMPFLTLTPDLEEPKPEVKQETQIAEKAPEAGPDMSMLTEEERQAVKSFAKQIDISNSQQILQYAQLRRRILRTFPRAPWTLFAPRTWARWAI